MSQPEPRVSVIIPCYNHGQYLPYAVQSVQAQTYSRWEMIIVDDGSTDQTAQIATELAAQDRRIRVLAQPNRGLGPSRNRGIAASHAEYILPLDADDALEPGMLEQTVPVLDSQPRVGFVYTDVQMFGAEQIIWSGGAFNPHKLLFDCPLTPMTLFRRCAWATTTGFGVLRYEDWDFWLSLVEQGWQGWHLAQPLVRYRRSEQGMLARAQREQDLRLRAALIQRHPRLYHTALLSWARHWYPLDTAAQPNQIQSLFAFTSYALLIGRYYRAHLPRTLLRPFYHRLPPRHKSRARHLARLLRLSQAQTLSRQAVNVKLRA